MVSKTLFSSNTGEWGTPLDLYKKLDEEFHFETDPCTTKDNPLGTKYFYTKDSDPDGLHSHWYGNTFINPPYGRQIGLWVENANWRHSCSGSIFENKPHHIVMLLPARTDTTWFHYWIYDQRTNTPYNKIEIRFLKGRLKFVGATNPAPFPSMIVIFRR